MPTASITPSSHLIICSPLLLLLSVVPSTGLFSRESVLLIRWPKYLSFFFRIWPSKEQSGLISSRNEWFDFFTVQGTLRSLLQHHNSKAVLLFFPVPLHSSSLRSRPPLMSHTSPSSPPVQPMVTISPTKDDPLSPLTLLLCTAASFYPWEIEIRWLKKGRRVTEGSSTGRSLMLEDTPRCGDVYTCMVEHASLETPITVLWGWPLSPFPLWVAPVHCVCLWLDWGKERRGLRRLGEGWPLWREQPRLVGG
uniref:Ig-like domain-containing protein n=1 Tax=Varanus komodoensis TaxID=61221 RepID=A0A8D2IVF9_VARKO